MWQRKRQIVGLDLGSTRIRTLVTEVADDGELRVTGFGDAESQGIRNGVVVNTAVAVEAAKQSITEAGRMAQADIDEVYVGVGGRRTRTVEGRATVPVAGGYVTETDIRTAVEAAVSDAQVPSREAIQVIPDGFVCNDSWPSENPLGLSAKSLTACIRVLSTSVGAIWDAVSVVNQAGRLVADTVSKPVAAAEAVLTDDEKSLGSAVVDVGGGETRVSVWLNGRLRHAAVTRIGSERLTRDVAIVYRMPPVEAERIKRTYGTAYVPQSDESLEFDGLHFGSFGVRKINHATLSEVLQARAEEVVEFVGAEIERAAVRERPISGLVLTGGGTHLRGMPELMEAKLHLPVRRGTPSRMRDPRFCLPELATVVGLAEHGERKSRSENWFARVRSQFGI